MHFRAVLQALFVTFLWSTSWVLIKIGLEEIPALIFAGLRYSLAFIILLPFSLRAHMTQSAPRPKLSRQSWMSLLSLGLLLYALTHGAQFLGLSYLPAVTVSLLLNFTPVLVALMGILLLSEHPSPVQWGGFGLYLMGIVIFFFPLVLLEGEIWGFIAMAVGILANAGSSVLGRHVNRSAQISPLLVTTISMGMGAFVLLIVGISAQGLPPLSLTSWGIIAWLAVVNTAFAFTLWNYTLRTLSAMESSIINNTMLIQIALLAWLFLDERLGWQKVIGMVIAGLGVLIVQLKRSSRVKRR